MNEHDDETMPETEPGADAPPPAVKTVEAWCEELKTPKWLFAGARIGHRWPIGLELTEKAYREALDAAASVVCR